MPNSKFMNVRQAKLSVQERNSEFMNEMNIHAEVHERPLGICVLYMAFELFTDGKSTSWGLCAGSIRYQQLDPLRALDAENRRCARPRSRLRHPLLLPPPIPAPGRSSCVLPLAEFAYRPRAAPRSWFRLVTRHPLPPRHARPLTRCRGHLLSDHGTPGSLPRMWLGGWVAGSSSSRRPRRG